MTDVVLAPEPVPAETPQHQAGQPHTAQHQRVGWLELSYDLVFVVVIKQLTHRCRCHSPAPRVTALSRRAFAVSLGFARPSAAGMTKEERRQLRDTRRAERKRQKAEGRDDGNHWGEILHWITFIAPLVVVWKIGGSWSPWIVEAVLFAYITANTWMHGVDERRIRRYLAEGGQFPGAAG